jgi:transposase
VIQVTPQMRILVAVKPVDFRRGIDGLAQICRTVLEADPFSGAMFVFRNRRSTALRALVYDGQGFWLCYKRLSKGKFRWWPKPGDRAVHPMQAHELQVLLRAGDPGSVRAAPDWRPVTPGVRAPSSQAQADPVL